MTVRKSGAVLFVSVFMVSLAAALFPLRISAASYGPNHFLAGYTQSVYDDESGMDSAEVNDLYQSSDGYIWIATYGGALRYDGSEFSHIENARNGEVPRVSAMALCEDDNGSMWIGTNGNGILIFSKEHVYELLGKERGLPSLSVRAIVKAPDGSMIVGTTNGVCRIDENRNVTVYKSTENMFIRDIAVSDDGKTYAITDTGEFVVICPEGKEYIQKFHYDFSCLRLMSNGKIQFGTVSYGLLESKIGVAMIEQPTQIISEKQASDIKDILKDNEGNVWVISQNGVGILGDNGALKKIKDLEIASNFSKAIQDSDGGYWICSDKYGILKLVKSEFSDFSFEYNIPDVIVNAVVKYQGDFYLGTDDGLIVVSKGVVIGNDLTRMLDGVRIRCVYADKEGNLRIATYGDETGLVTVKPDGTYFCTTVEDGIPNGKVRIVNGLDDGRILIGTADGAAILDGEEITATYVTEDGLPNSVILCSAQSADGTIYLGTDGGGIFTISPDGKTTDVIDEEDGLDGEVILRMTRDDENGVIWISTGNSITCLKDNKVCAVDSVGIYNNVFDFIPKHDGNVWITTANAIYVASAEDILNNDGELSIRSIKRSHGLSSSMCSNSWNYLDKDGLLYLCCIEGVNSIDTNSDSKEEVIPNIILSSVDYGDETLYGKTEIIIPSNTDRLTVNLSVINFVSSDGTIVEYQFIGQDNEPISINSNNLDSISYTNLKGGRYYFVVSVHDENGECISKKTLLTIIKRRTFAELPGVTAGSIIIIVAIIVFIVSRIFRLREKAILKRQREIKEILMQAIQAVINTIDAKDAYTSGHSMRVADYSVKIGRRLKMKEEELENLYYVALLHDVGKIGVPDVILNKPGRLNPEEFEIMKQHVTKGGEILSNITSIKDVSLGAKQHHEKFDGTGYTEGLKGEEICLAARIICVADSFDAMATNRAYRKHLEKQKILNELYRCRGTQFDPKVDDIMVEMITSGELDNVFEDE